MDSIKQAVTQTLEKQGIISQLKAQLRAQVFIAVEEYEGSSSGAGIAGKTSVPARSALLADADGKLVVQLVLDLLDTCNFAFTKQVFQPELGPDAPSSAREAAAAKLGLKASSVDEPLLLALVKAYKSGSPSRPAADTTTKPTTSTSGIPSASAAAASAPSPAPASTSTSSAPRSALPAAPLSRLEPLAPVSKPSSLAPLAPLGGSGIGGGKAPVASGIGGGVSTSAAPAAAAAAKPAVAAPAAEPSGEESAYSDEVFEEEPVEEDVEEEELEVGGAGQDDDDDDEDDDYATAMGFKSGGGSKDAVGGRSGSTSGGGADAGASGRDRPGGLGHTALDADLMAGDRSFGVSNELAGLDAGNSGGLSFSNDFGGGGGPGDVRASLSSSQAMLSPISEGAPKLAKLEPLRPLGGPKLSPLAPLAPLPTIGTLSSSLSSSKDDPLGSKGLKSLGPLGGGGARKSLADIEKEKEELRRMGLLSGDSLASSMEAESRPRASGPPTNIYDAEMSVSASMDDAGAWGASAGGAGAGSGGGYGERSMPFGSKGLSMDLRDTGLSASDRSGDIEQMGADLAETAEWH